MKHCSIGHDTALRANWSMIPEDSFSSRSTQAPRFSPDQAWDLLSEILEEFCDAWENAPPEPDLQAYSSRLNAMPDPELVLTGLKELIKVDLEYRAREEFQAKPLEDYLEQFPELCGEDNSPPADLVYEEFQLGSKNESDVSVDQYRERFPNQFDALMRLVNTGSLQTTSLLRTRNVAEFEPGQTIDDFDLLSKLGKGAFASVFLARQNSMQRLVALKVSANQGLEGQTLAQLDHPHIVRVYDQRVIPDQDLRLMYMQYIAGGSFSDVIKMCKEKGKQLSPEAFLQSLDQLLENAGQSPPIDSSNRIWIASANWPEVVSRIGAQLAGALEYAHKLGVLHRDLKPANILVDGNGFPKLVDFNVSFSNKVAGATASSYFGGSLGYMSPEQMEACSPSFDREAGDLTGQSDVFSLGVMLYELLLGKRPFDDNCAFDVSEMIRDRQNGITPETKDELQSQEFLLQQAIERCVDPDPEKRLTPRSLKRQLEWASDSTIDDYLNPRQSGWRQWCSCFPTWIAIGVSFAIALFATWFIITYNLDAAIAEKDQSLYSRLQQFLNPILFAGGTLVMFLRFRLPNEILRNPNHPYSAKEVESAIKINLNYGLYAAVMFAIVWSLAGILYPLTLFILGAELSLRDWSDFVGSHVLAAAITASYVFCAVTCIAWTAWHPRLVVASVRNDSSFESLDEAKKTRTHLVVAQVLAIATPMAAVAILVNVRDDTSSFALGVLSVAALVGLGFLGWASRWIQRSISAVEKMDSN